MGPAVAAQQSTSLKAMGSALCGATYSYGGIEYANPHAPTGIWLGYATSTLVYDANGNVTQYGTTTAYTYDYRNRINAAGVLGAPPPTRSTTPSSVCGRR